MVQTNVVRRDGRRAVLMTILKGEGASSLDVVNRVREALPGIQAQLPPELKMELLFDQSVFVRAAVEGVLKEGAIAAGLTALDDPRCSSARGGARSSSPSRSRCRFSPRSSSCGRWASRSTS